MMLHLNEDHISMLDSIEKRSEEMLGLTRAVCEINSGSYHLEGVFQAGQWFKNHISHLFDEVSEQQLPSLDEVNAEGVVDTWETAPCWVFRQNVFAPMQILCTGHLDTVFAKDSDFQSTWIEGDLLRGPGVADMKGGLIVLYTALSAFFKSPWSKACGVTVVLSPDEEIGSRGSAGVLARYGTQAHVGLTYEPAWSDGTLAGARKGSGNYDVVIKGKSAHAGRDFFSGKNAIQAAALLTRRLSDLCDESTGITVNVSRIDGGSAVNVVPDKAVVRFNVRVFTEEQRQSVEALIDACLLELAIQTGCEFKRFGSFNRPPKPMTPEHQRLFETVKHVGKALGLDISWKPTGGCCEGNNLAALGLPNVDTLGVRGGNIHSDQEFAVINSFVERAQLSALLLAELCDQREYYVARKTC